MAGQQPPPDVVFRIGDGLSFISFMVRLRQTLANHTEQAERNDIMDQHPDPNLSITQTHPLLPRQRRPDQPLRWIRIKLEVDETTSTTLVMRDDNLYVHGFMNGDGVWYELLEHWDSQNLLPEAEFIPRGILPWWGLGYPRLLRVPHGKWDERQCAVAERLERQICNSGKAFVVKAVRALWAYQYQYIHQHSYMDTRVALAGLFVIVSESARMNPLHDAIACGWNRRHNRKGLTKQLMLDYVWSYGGMSKRLREWKEGNYAEQNRVPDLLDTYLVLNWDI